MEEAVTCSIFKSSRREFLFVYLPTPEGFDQLPEPVRRYFGAPIHVMDLELTPERTLANAESPQVIAALKAQGFYLQMPPSEPLPI